MRTALICLILCIASTVHADPEKWTHTDTTVELAFAATLAADWIQTRHIQADGIESNPLLGKDGMLIPRYCYFPTVFVAHAFVAYVLPQPYRRIMQGVSIGIELDVVHTNFQAGYSLTF